MLLFIYLFHVLPTVSAESGSVDLYTMSMPTTCSYEERNSHLMSSCSLPLQTTSKNLLPVWHAELPAWNYTTWLWSLTEQELKALTTYWLVDERNKVMACLTFKTGSTTWNTILCLNSLPGNITTTNSHYITCLKNNGVVSLGGSSSHYSKEQIIERITSYYKILTVRHPFDRLVSAWLSKFRNRKTEWQVAKTLLDTIKKTSTRQSLKGVNRVFFQDLIAYIMMRGSNGHWDGPYAKRCHPCEIHPNAIVKTETYSRDIPHIVEMRLRGRGADEYKNKESKVAWSHHFTKILTEFENITDTQLDFLAEKYKLDFKQFGYTFQRNRNGSLEVSCGIKSHSGSICC